MFCGILAGGGREMLQSDCERLDPRIRRTRQLLQDALRNLLKQKEFDKISVQDITEAATVNRATFYAHFEDKFALLGELIRITFLDLLAQRNATFDGGCSTAFQVIILAVCDYLSELQKSHRFAGWIPASPGGTQHPGRNDCRNGKLGDLWGGEAVGQYRGASFRGGICRRCGRTGAADRDGRSRAISAG